MDFEDLGLAWVDPDFPGDGHETLPERIELLPRVPNRLTPEERADILLRDVTESVAADLGEDV